MRLAFWTPAPEADWLAPLVAALARELDLTLVRAEPGERPRADLDLYHLAGSADHGFVYRALRQRPGIVLLAEWRLHALVHAETAGRGDAAGYLREARHAHGDTGVFVARQVLAGIGGVLPALVAMNQRVLEASLAVVVLTDEVRERAAALVRDRRVVRLAQGGGEAGAREAARSLVAVAAEILQRAEELRRALETRAAAAGPRALALDELGWAARELGLAEPPQDAAALVSGLFGDGH